MRITGSSPVGHIEQKFCSVECCQKALKISLRKRERPVKEVLDTLVNEMPFTKIASLYGVSDNAIRKWYKAYGIPLPKRLGYWAKVYAGKI